MVKLDYFWNYDLFKTYFWSISMFLYFDKRFRFFRYLDLAALLQMHWEGGGDGPPCVRLRPGLLLGAHNTAQHTKNRKVLNGGIFFLAIPFFWRYRQQKQNRKKFVSLLSLLCNIFFQPTCFIIIKDSKNFQVCYNFSI